MLKTLTRPAAAAAILVVPLAACGGGSSTASPDFTSATVKVHALDSLKFDQAQYTAPAGDVKIGEVNDGAQAHTLLIDGKSNFKLSVPSHGDTKAASVNLAEGTYVIYCDIPTHRESGMEAKLVITAPAPASGSGGSAN